ncbi:phospholipid scramblase 1-like [Planococcus citri]|uniref:phospholipid scramblase 1-like n=1 Tax=Planococcus citri TaxID=170843 RepID=UPI0031F7DCC3
MEMSQGANNRSAGFTPVSTQSQAYAPAGLQSLINVDHLFVKQQYERLEAFTGFETCNKYVVKDQQGHDVFYAFEEDDTCARMCYSASQRPFEMSILNKDQVEVIHVRRDVDCSCCGSHQLLEVYSPPGNFIGSIEQNFTIFTPEFDVKNESGEVVLRIEGPLIRSAVFSDAEFKVMTVDKSAVIGKISKTWSGLARELFTDSDFFGITFPADLDVRTKAKLIGACFLIDFMYYES